MKDPTGPNLDSLPSPDHHQHCTPLPLPKTLLGIFRHTPSTMPLLEPHENFNLYSDLIDVRVLGEEQVNGVPATKVRGNINMQSKVEKIWGNPETQSPELSAGSEDPRGQFLAGSEEFTGWVGINDGLLHAYELHGSYPAFGELLQFEYSLRAEYFDFNEPLVLPTPYPLKSLPSP